MTVVSLDCVSKAYTLAPKAGTRMLDALCRRDPKDHGFWALRDVSFSLEQGETLGVLGVNGAGKSTLLKLISGVSGPTRGEVRVNGRTGALLELGAGFFPEYTGLENARLTLAMNGIKGAEAKAALEEAVAFADIGEFVEKPVKLYSSGMFVRLAFAVATATRPDVLLVDEALSVGDLFFQARCVERMKAMLAAGTALIFVSHDLGAVKSLCQKALLLEGGKPVMLADAESVARRYYELKVAGENRETTVKETGDMGDGRAEIASVALLDEHGRPVESATFAQPLELVVTIRFCQAVASAVVGFHIEDHTGVDVAYCDTAIADAPMENVPAGAQRCVRFRFDARLGEGSHNIAVVCSEPIDLERGAANILQHRHCACQFVMERRPHAKIYGLTSPVTQVEIT